MAVRQIANLSRLHRDTFTGRYSIQADMEAEHLEDETMSKFGISEFTVSNAFKPTYFYRLGLPMMNELGYDLMIKEKEDI